MTKQERRIARITKMEASLNALTAANAAMEQALGAFRGVPAKAAALSGYLGSESWWQDFEADAEGALPADLPRGVLSEDGIYNALDDYRALLEEMLKAVTDAVKNG